MVGVLKDMVRRADIHRAAEEFMDVIAEEVPVPDHAGQDRTDRQHRDRHQHRPRGFVGMPVCAGIAPFGTEEGHEDQSPRIEAGHQRAHHEKPEPDAAAAARTGEHRFDDRILRQEPGESEMGHGNADPGDRKRADQHHPERCGYPGAERTVVPHVLIMVHRMNDRSSPQEQECLEEGMGEEVEHRRLVDADAGGGEHVSELGTGRIGDHPLDVVLDEADRGGKERGGHPDHRNDRQCNRCEFEQRREPAHQEDPGRNHGGGMDQRRDRRRPLHRIRQPGVQEQLGRLAAGAHEQEHGGQLGGVEFHPQESDRHLRQLLRPREDVIEADRVHQHEEQEEAERHAEIADPIDDERLDRRRVRRGFAVVEPDEQIGGNADALPAEEQLHHVVGCHQRQHREGEERQIGEEPGPVGFALLPLRVGMHVAEAVEVHERRDRGHHHEHDRGEPVEPDRPVRGEGAAVDEPEDVDLLGFALESDEHEPAQHGGQEQQPGGDDNCGPLPDQPVAEPAKNGPHQGGEENQRGHTPGQPFIRLTSSTAIESRFLKKQTRIASPIAASAAATVSTNSVKICPVRSPR